jgi:mannose-6-phosphate isomerase-like protein (cupin superfamily)
MTFDTKMIGGAPDVIAPDGSDVRILCQMAGGSMAHFTLRPGVVSRAVAHRTIDEVWYVVAGSGRMWRRLGDDEAIVALAPGTSLTIPVGTRFQFRCDGPEALVAVGVAMPPWPGDDEARTVEGPWAPTA